MTLYRSNWTELKKLTHGRCSIRMLSSELNWNIKYSVNVISVLLPLDNRMTAGRPYSYCKFQSLVDLIHSNPSTWRTTNGNNLSTDPVSNTCCTRHGISQSRVAGISCGPHWTQPREQHHNKLHDKCSQLSNRRSTKVFLERPSKYMHSVLSPLHHLQICSFSITI